MLGFDYKPKSGQLLYHYCSAETFVSIVQTKNLRFGDLFSMNDASELHHGYNVFEKAASNVLRDVGKSFLDQIDIRLSLFGLNMLNTAVCFSEDGDLLGQWRSYADDGRGFVIGFEASDIIQMAVTPLKVVYEEDAQLTQMEGVVRSLHEVEKSEGFTYGSDFSQTCYLIAANFACFKNSSFREEQEVRLIHLLDFQPSNKFMRLSDAGGTAWKKKVRGVPVQLG